MAHSDFVDTKSPNALKLITEIAWTASASLSLLSYKISWSTVWKTLDKSINATLIKSVKINTFLTKYFYLMVYRIREDYIIDYTQIRQNKYRVHISTNHVNVFHVVTLRNIPWLKINLDYKWKNSEFILCSYSVYRLKLIQIHALQFKNIDENWEPPPTLIVEVKSVSYNILMPWKWTLKCVQSVPYTCQPLSQFMGFFPLVVLFFNFSLQFHHWPKDVIVSI